MELCCLDVQKSSNKANICIRRLGEILLKGWLVKKKVRFKQFYHLLPFFVCLWLMCGLLENYIACSSI